MTIDEAIEVLEQERHDHHSLSTDTIGQAEQLGIEALKFARENRGEGAGHVPKLLPGETET